MQGGERLMSGVSCQLGEGTETITASYELRKSDALL